VRLNRYLAAAGLGSRRACEALITEGRVTLNGQPCTALATAVQPKDSVKVDGRLIQAERATYVLLNKPTGFPPAIRAAGAAVSLPGKTAR
jgi:23S rRNA pseudouridine2605 synthase